MVQYKRILTRSWLIFEFILYVKQNLTIFLLTGDVRIVKFIRACLSLRFRSKVEVADVARGPFRPHTTPTLVLLSQLFSFLDLGDVVVGYFDHIPNSQLKWRKLRCHPLVYRKICPNLLLPRSMLRIIVEKDVVIPSPRKSSLTFPRLNDNWWCLSFTMPTPKFNPWTLSEKQLWMLQTTQGVEC